jgi:photolyase PhrII
MNSTNVEKLRQILGELPQHLGERTYVRSHGRSENNGQQVLYWTHHALRVDENPALEVAKHLAVQFQLPLLVYQGLSERYRFACDRHHTFILEAARDLQLKYAERGMAYTLYVDRAGHRYPRLATLAKTSAAVVTDDFPIEATKLWTDRLATVDWAPIVLVDTACVVPSRLVGQAYDRAFAFRNATASLYRERIDRAWPICEIAPASATSPFETLNLNDQSLASIVSECDIDHTVGPVADTRGGSDAGYARWQAFRENGLRGYAKRRNQIEINGVSRMSAYLHYGMVSPMRIAREASADGAEKYLDELLIWRELSYAFCHFQKELESDAGLPEWAVATLEKHADDPRHCLSWETLSRARSGEQLWDAAQRSLIKHGELHNNLRMTWGKAILAWSENHRQALERLIDLNHRYALDGRDPASYGGILWCLGQFDRPFTPEQPILGSVRPRPVAYHARRTDLIAYENRVDRSVANPMPRIAVIGTGLAGLMCARILTDHGFSVQCYDKSHRPGGRASTRLANDEYQFDHGAQYFTVRDSVLSRYLESWCADQHVAPWNGRIVSIDHPGQFGDLELTKRYVGIPKMESLAHHLANDLAIECSAEVIQVVSGKDGYELFGKINRSLGAFDIVLWNCPPAQVEKLVPIDCNWRNQLDGVNMVPCWAVMIALEERWNVPFDGAFVNQGSLSWIARDSSKPARMQRTDNWVLHSSVAWASNQLQASKEEVVANLIQEAERVADTKMSMRRVTTAHRWLYARPNEALSQASLWDDQHRLGACGDWCGGPRVEGALKSGMSLAGKVMGSIHEWSSDMPTDSSLPSGIQLELF